MTSQNDSSSNILELHNVSKIFSDTDELKAVSDLSLSLRVGEFLCILGPSGCGKTTVLRMMSGLLPVSSGTVLLSGKPVEQTSKDAVLVFQEYSRSLLPWRRVLDNIKLGLEAKGIEREEQNSIAQRFLDMVGLKGFERHYPWQLSGGMQQRVALARALACSPKVLLMDEPFGSIDARTKADLEDQLLKIWMELKLSIALVTHDIEEAIYLGERLVVLTSRPAMIQGIEHVPFSYPRDQLTTKNSADFLKLRTKLLRALRGY